MLLESNAISKRFYLAGKAFWALEDISFSVEEGDFVCISGASGSGKTTLLNILAGILKPSRGTISLKGHNIHKLPDRKLARMRGRDYGFVYQRFNLIPHLTVFENVRAPLYFEKGGLKMAHKKVQDILTRMGIQEKMHEYPLNLSGGQQQRAAIARALIRQPSILLADEPTGNLDATTGQEIIDLFTELNQKEGMTILAVTHDERFLQAANTHLKLDFGHLQELPLDKLDPSLSAGPAGNKTGQSRKKKTGASSRKKSSKTKNKDKRTKTAGGKNSTKSSKQAKSAKGSQSRKDNKNKEETSGTIPPGKNKNTTKKTGSQSGKKG